VRDQLLETIVEPRAGKFDELAWQRGRSWRFQNDDTQSSVLSKPLNVREKCSHATVLPRAMATTERFMVRKSAHLGMSSTLRRFVRKASPSQFTPAANSPGCQDIRRALRHARPLPGKGGALESGHCNSIRNRRSLVGVMRLQFQQERPGRRPALPFGSDPYPRLIGIRPTLEPIGILRAVMGGIKFLQGDFSLNPH